MNRHRNRSKTFLRSVLEISKFSPQTTQLINYFSWLFNFIFSFSIGIISLCWLFGSVLGFLPVFGWHNETGHNEQCFFTDIMDYNYLVFLYFTTIITPSIILAVFYGLIYRVILKQVSTFCNGERKSFIRQQGK